MTDRFVVIPTRFNRATTLPLIEVCNRVATTVVVHTEPHHARINGTVMVDDSDSNSIQHWWNAGLDKCSGPTLVLNDDIVADEDSLMHLFFTLEQVDVVYLAGHRIGHRTPLTGWCYGIHPDRIRPDNAFGWWAGDDDLYLRAMAAGMKVTAVDLPNIRHERAAAAFENPIHAAMVDADMRLLAERWG